MISDRSREFINNGFAKVKSGYDGKWVWRLTCKRRRMKQRARLFDSEYLTAYKEIRAMSKAVFGKYAR